MLGPCAPSTCIRHVGHIPCTLGFGPRGRSTQAASQAGGGPLRGARRDAHVGAFCVTIAAFCIEFAALCLEIAAFCIEIVTLLPLHHNCSVAHRNGGTRHRNGGSRGESAPSRPSFQRLSSEAMASGRQALEPSGRLSLGGHGERKNVLRGTGKRIRCASS